MLRKICPLLFAVLLTPALRAQSTWFPLTLPWDDSSKTIIDASGLLVDYPGQDPSTVIDARGFVRASTDGHFYFANTGKRARFWGVNFTFNASFPPCPDEPLRPGDSGVFRSDMGELECYFGRRRMRNAGREGNFWALSRRTKTKEVRRERKSGERLTFVTLQETRNRI